MQNLVQRIETYIQDYVTLADRQYALPIALWTIGTFCFNEFDAYPYLCITAATKRSGKTRLSEMISFACSNPRNFAALTPSTIFRSIEKEAPTLLFDEAEELVSESAGTMRSVLNVGYRRGQTVPRIDNVGGIKEYPTYCPKVFVLIGDVFDTLRDRSIVIVMQRAETRKRFMFETARNKGAEIRAEIDAAVKARMTEIQNAFQNHDGLPFLMDRDEEIWTSLFCLAEVFCPARLEELKAISVDMATEKTVKAKRYINLKHAETKATDDEYGRRLLTDLYSLFVVSGTKLSTTDAVEQLKAIPTAPWRKFRGNGITASDMAKMLSRFGVHPVRIAEGSGRGKQTFKRGYKRSDVEKGMQKL